MKYWIYLLTIIILGILQLTFLDYFKVFGIKPDLLLISVVIASLVFEFKWAFILSLFAGLFKDVFSATTFGINTLLFPLWSFLIARLNKEITIDYNFIRMALIFIISLLHNTITGLTFIYLGNPISLGIFLRIVSVQSIYTVLLLPLVFNINKLSFFYKND